MASKTFGSRIILKHDTEANWNNAINFIPLIGEIIIYDPDETYHYSRVKIGDGTTSVINLPFELDSFEFITTDDIDIICNSSV